MKSEISEKIMAVAELSDVVSKYQGNVDFMEYEVYKNKEHEFITEFLVIHYKGGAITVRTCTGNSFYAIFQEVSNYLYSGKYDELDYRKAVIEKSERIYC